MMDNPLDGRGRPAAPPDVPLAAQISYLRAMLAGVRAQTPAAVAQGIMGAHEVDAAIAPLEAALRTLSLLQLACGELAIPPRDHLDAPATMDPLGAIGWAKGWNAARLAFEERAAADVPA